MKKELTIALAAIAILAAGSVYAGTTNKFKTVNNNQVQKLDQTKTHRYIHVYANREITESSSHDNMTENDWDRGFNRSDYTDSEWAYLQTLTDLKGGVNYYIDLTNSTCSTVAPVTNTWTEVDSNVSRTVKVVDGVVVTTNSKTITETKKGDIYQLVADAYDSSPI